MGREWTAIVPSGVWPRREDAGLVEVIVDRHDDGGDAYALVVAGPWRAADAAAVRDAPRAPGPGALIVATPVADAPHVWRVPRPPRGAAPEYAAFLVCASGGPQRFGPMQDAPRRLPDADPGPRADPRARPWVPILAPPPDEAALRQAVGDALRETVEGWQPALVALA